MIDRKKGNYDIKDIRQICFLYENCKKAARDWAALMGAGPWMVSRNTPIENLEYMGKPCDWLQDSALGQFPPLQVELMETCDDSPAVHYQPGPNGRIHHMNWFVDDLDAETERLAALGFPKVWSCCCGPDKMRMAMYDGGKFCNCLFEVYEYNPNIGATYDRIAQRHEDWDGQDPIFAVYDNATGQIVQEDD